MSLSHSLRYSEWTRPFWWLVAIPTAVILWAALKLVWLTSKVRFSRNGYRYKEAAIYVNWHRHLPFTMFVHGRSHRWMMMLGAPYMAPIAAWSRAMGLQLVRGATGHGGRDALARLGEKLAQDESVVLAVDGPAGPAFTVKPGCVELALSAGVPIIPVAYRSRRQREVAGRWDRLLLIMPFDDISVKVGQPIFVEKEKTVQEMLTIVERALRELDPAIGQ